MTAVADTPSDFSCRYKSGSVAETIYHNINTTICSYVVASYM